MSHSSKRPLSPSVPGSEVSLKRSKEKMDADPAMSSPSLLDEPVDYRDLKAWIEEQERNPQPLTKLQQRAIADLTRSLRATVRQRDWVSMLNIFTQVHGSMVKYPEPTVDNQQWISQCFLGLPGETQSRVFPSSEHGLIPVNGIPTAPCFASKKDAKQYAAKCCAEWLISAGHMTPEGRPPKGSARPQMSSYVPPVADAAAKEATAVAPLPNQHYYASQKAFRTPLVDPAVPSPQPTIDDAALMPPPPPPVIDDAALMPPPPLPSNTNPPRRTSNFPSIPVRTTTPWSSQPATTTPPLTEGEEETDDDDDQRPATLRVVELCQRLGLVVPQYHIKPSETPGTDPSTAVASWISSGSGSGSGGESDGNGNKSTNSSTASLTGATTTPAPPAAKKKHWASDTESEGSLPSWSPTINTTTTVTTTAQTPAPTPAPTPTPTVPLYDACPDFGRDRIKVPVGLGRVTRVYGKKNAKQKVAEEVLKWLRMEEKAREQAVMELVETLEPVREPAS